MHAGVNGGLLLCCCGAREIMECDKLHAKELGVGGGKR